MNLQVFTISQTFDRKTVISASLEVKTTTFTGFYFQSWDLFLLHKEVIQSYSTDIIARAFAAAKRLNHPQTNSQDSDLQTCSKAAWQESRKRCFTGKQRELLVLLADSSECYLSNTTHQPLGSFKTTTRLPSTQRSSQGRPHPWCAHV